MIPWSKEYNAWTYVLRIWLVLLFSSALLRSNFARVSAWALKARNSMLRPSRSASIARLFDIFSDKWSSYLSLLNSVLNVSKRRCLSFLSLIIVLSLEASFWTASTSDSALKISFWSLVYMDNWLVPSFWRVHQKRDLTARSRAFSLRCLYRSRSLWSFRSVALYSSFFVRLLL